MRSTMSRWFQLIFSSLAVSLAAHAQVTMALQSPPTVISGGTTQEIILLLTNSGNGPAIEDVPAVIPLLAATPMGARGFVLKRADDQPAKVTVEGGGFARVRYTALVPRHATGLGVLAAEDPRYGRFAVEVRPAEAAPPANAAQGAAVESRAPGGGIAPPALESRRALGVLPYEPVYFSLGAHRLVNARFQLSLKLRPFGPSDERVDVAESFLGNLYGGFTQTSVWDLESLSKPFFDSSYKPTVLYQRYDTGQTLLGAKVGYAAGFEHESNGQGGAASRSMNLLVFRPTLRWPWTDGWVAVFSPKLYAYVEKEENADIPRYRGYGDYLFFVENPESWKLAATVRLGTSGKGSLLFDGSYPMRRLLGDISPTGWAQGFLHLQYFNGYTESLRTYNLRTPWQIRAGYMLVR